MPRFGYAQRWHTYALPVLAVLLATGCTHQPAAAGAGAAGPGGAGAAASARAALLESADLRLPLDAYLPSIAETARLAAASRTLLEHCLAGFGVHYTAPVPASAGPRTWNERRYGLADAAQAGAGYWPQDRVARPRPRHQPATGASADQVAALVTGTGARTVNHRRVPAGGCTAEAYRQLTAHDPPGADRYLAQRLSSDSFFASQRAPAVAQVFRDWSACMRAAGYSYPTPLDPPRDARFQGPAAAPLEIGTARADVACKQRTNLVGVWYATETATQTALVAANRAALRAGRAAYDAELAVAARAAA